jgi:hypothetical protein
MRVVKGASHQETHEQKVGQASIRSFSRTSGDTTDQVQRGPRTRPPSTSHFSPTLDPNISPGLTPLPIRPRTQSAPPSTASRALPLCAHVDLSRVTQGVHLQVIEAVGLGAGTGGVDSRSGGFIRSHLARPPVLRRVCVLTGGFGSGAILPATVVAAKLRFLGRRDEPQSHLHPLYPIACMSSSQDKGNRVGGLVGSVTN